MAHFHGEGTLSAAGLGPFVLGVTPLGAGVLGGGFGEGEQVVQQATHIVPAMAAQVGVEAMVLTDALDRCLRMTLTAIEQGASPEVVMYAWSFLLALAWVIYARHQTTK